MLEFIQAKWIWADWCAQKDEYTDYTDSFLWDGNGSLEIVISADSNYTLYLNGELIGFEQYSDYPSYKVGDRIDLTPYARVGENRLAVTVWYFGQNSQTYILGEAGLIYELHANGQVLAASSPSTLSRLSPSYVSGECHDITSQLGFTYHFNNQTHDGFPQSVDLSSFAPSREVTGITYEIHERPIKRLLLDPRLSAKTVQQGIFSNTANTDHLGRDMQSASLTLLKQGELSEDGEKNLSADGGDGIYLILDLGAEAVGFLDLDFETDAPCRVDIGYGEHLADGRCRTGVRNFTCRFDARGGRNRFLNTFRRFGCRYLQFHIYTHKVKVHYLGLRPVRYPLTYRELPTDHLLRKTVWRVCQHTLECCMHVHYEDCPWREQALYTLDSRNQMLCGYYAFGEKDFARASLELISHGLREDGLLSICYPAGKDLPIPAFSLVYFLQMREYIDHTEDTSLSQSCFPILVRLLSTFSAKYTERGVIENFYDDAGTYWNFYDWTPTMRGNSTERRVEAPLNAFYSLALQNMAQICYALGKPEDAQRYEAEADTLNRAIATVFFDEKVELFRSFEEDSSGIYTVLTNSLCLLCGAAKGLPKDRILRILEANGAADTGLEVHANTLSMNGFRYDALLSVDRRSYSRVILDEIDRIYFEMLRHGTTTFWETAVGEADFHGAGSLCHGWSALPIYYYATLLQNP